MEIIENGFRFRVGLSFAGEDRDYVEKVAEQLTETLGQEKVFYDYNYIAEFAGFDLDIHLQKIYREECELIVVFIGEFYNKKPWCKVEWQTIRGLDFIKPNGNKLIMLIRMDDGAVDGVPPNAGFIHAGKFSPPEIASFIIKRLNSNNITQNYEDKPVLGSKNPVTDLKASKVKANSSKHSYTLLNPCNFDLEQLIRESMKVLLVKTQGLFGLAIPCNDDAFRNHFCERLKEDDGISNARIINTLTLDRKKSNLEYTVNSIKRYKKCLEKEDIICPIRVEVNKKDKSYSDEFWQEICTAFPNVERRLIIIMVGSKDKIFPKDVKKLEPPKFEEVDVRQWVIKISKIRRWEEDIIQEWMQTMITDCRPSHSPSEQMDIGSVYDHLSYSQELLRRNPPPPAKAFLEELKQRIPADV
ncbi:TIR domain-containing protein [Nostoc sp.]|uniref:TIR domain-containing protein n=1 Tax=Nostoc sp. TaxID=1180 RepID=UPI002FF772CD